MSATWSIDLPAAEETASASSLASRQPRLLTRGIVLPFRRGPGGDFATATGVELVLSNVRQILDMHAQSPSGGQGDLEWDTARGSRLHLLRHRMITSTTRELAALWARETLAAYEPRARVSGCIVQLGPPANPRTRRMIRVVLAIDVIDASGTVLAENQIVQLSPLTV